MRSQRKPTVDSAIDSDRNYLSTDVGLKVKWWCDKESFFFLLWSAYLNTDGLDNKKGQQAEQYINWSFSEMKSLSVHWINTKHVF